jgi:hypothetical protein
MPQSSPTSVWSRSSPPGTSLRGAGENLPSEPSGYPVQREAETPANDLGFDPLPVEDPLAGVSPPATPHIQSAPDDDDWDPFADQENQSVAESGTCWVCGKDFEDSIIDFAPYGRHRSCVLTAQRMDAGFREQRRRKQAATAGGNFNPWTVQW